MTLQTVTERRLDRPTMAAPGVFTLPDGEGKRINVEPTFLLRYGLVHAEVDVDGPDGERRS